MGHATKVRRDGWTPARREQFLEQLAQHGKARAAAAACGLSRQSAYMLRRRDPAFARYLRDSGLLAYWREHGFPVQCQPDGDGARCD